MKRIYTYLHMSIFPFSHSIRYFLRASNPVQCPGAICRAITITSGSNKPPRPAHHGAGAEVARADRPLLLYIGGPAPASAQWLAVS